MARIFISYRRADTAAMSRRIYDELVKRVGKRRVFRDVDSLMKGQDFRAGIERFIFQSNVMLVLIGDKWLNIADTNTGERRLDNPEDFVRIEVDMGLRHIKTVIPVLVNGANMPSEAELPVRLSGLAFKNAIQVNDTTFDEDFNALMRAIGYRNYLTWMLGLLAAVLLFAGVLGLSQFIGDPASADEPTTAVAAAQNPTEEPTDTPQPTPTETPAPTDTPQPTATETPAPTSTETSAPTETPVPTDTPQPTDTEIPTLSAFDALQTVQAELTQAAETQAVFDLTATEQAITDGTATAVAVVIGATETAAHATLLALSATPTPPPTDTNTPTATNTPRPTNTPDPIQAAFVPVTRNADWTPVEREFEMPQGGTVTMVLVSAGCFDMGSDNGRSDEQPVHQQCFDEPFWIDKYEVTQAQFRRLGGTKANPSGFSGDDRPVERITWFEARDFCELREARLPTEAEWEYAARGPDNLVYPWGNTWSASNAVWNRSSSQGTANVGSIPVGVSWVGALDMSGNVWEWTSSLYESYPYDEMDSREADTGSRTDVRRVLRGGSWSNGSSDFLRAPVRISFFPSSGGDFFGFRCARSFE